MHRPEVTIPNAENVYKFYRHYHPNKYAALIGHGAMAAGFRPITKFQTGAEAALDERVRAGHRIIITPNHLTKYDQSVVAALPIWVPVFRSFMGHTLILTKQSLFQNPYLRRGIDIMGAIPVFRSRDNKDATDELREMRRYATAQMLDTCVERLVKGDNGALFPEETRNEVDPSVVQTIKSGVGRIAAAVALEVPVSTVGIGIVYAGHTFTPNVYIDFPNDVDPKHTPDEVVDLVQLSMQRSVNAATVESQLRAYHQGNVL